MDVAEAQREYAARLDGAEPVLCSPRCSTLSRMICVEINSAVVTKLADRGSFESTRVVTDVGLFLKLLAEQLRELCLRRGRRRLSLDRAGPCV